MNCFQPMMEEFRGRYGKYPEYPAVNDRYGLTALHPMANYDILS